MKIPLGLETIQIIIICVGTDMFPAVALAYEEPEDLIMTVPPRSRDAHVVTWKMMAVSYGHIGILETIVAYFSWYWVLYAYGFTFDSLLGSSVGYGSPYDELPKSQ